MNILQNDLIDTWNQRLDGWNELTGQKKGLKKKMNRISGQNEGTDWMHRSDRAGQIQGITGWME